MVDRKMLPELQTFILIIIIELTIGKKQLAKSNWQTWLLLAYCPLSIVHCPLPIVHCPLPIAYCLLLIAHCLFQPISSFLSLNETFV